MFRNIKRTPLFSLLILVLLSADRGRTAQPAPPDLTRQPTLYVVPYAHLDTQWRWDYPQVIREFLPKTMHDNFALFEKYPHYIFNFSGANRYRLMKEYYPSDYAKVKQYVAAGRWFPSSSSMEEEDVNNPSAESILRQILYGKQYFRRDFGKTSAEFMLPDCFGFPASLPSILAHAGLKGFSTQKLSWHSGARVGGPGSPEDTPAGIPFNVGLWEGPDGRSVIAALNATDYNGEVAEDISKSPAPPDAAAEKRPTDWPKRVQKDGEASGLFVDYRYYGRGDTGGSPPESSVRLMEAILTKNDGPLHIIQATADQMFLDIKPEQTSRLPRYKGDLELIEHSAGSLTSQAYLKRWNRKNELLADAAERASVAAAWLGGRPYPLEQLNQAWTLVMGGQFHDIIPGTSLPKAYEYSWNDEILAMNQFAGVLASATDAVASALNTQAKGTAVVVYNPLSVAREDAVEATVSFPKGMPKAVQVVGPDGKEVPAQVEGKKVLFLAKVPSVGYAAYDVRPADTTPPSSALKVTESSLENKRYRIKLNQGGDVSSIFDKALGKELLSAPVRLAFKLDQPVDWPAWNMDWADQQKPPRAYLSGPAKIRIVEDGPVRVALRIERESEGSKFVQTLRLAAGDAGNRVEFSDIIDWRTSASNLKAVFPLTASNPLATYNWDIGTVQRHNDDEKMFEFPSHQWFDLTDKSGAFGVTVLSDCKNGSDKPDDGTLQLTLLRTPGIGTGNGRDYADQTTQDWGHHEIVYGLASHAGDYRQGGTDWQAYRLNQPLIAFESPKHGGAFGKSLSLAKVNNDRVRVLALKKAEESDEVVIRLVETGGTPQRDVRIAFIAPVTEAREVNGAEEAVGKAAVEDGRLVASFDPYQPRTFALRLKPAAGGERVAPPRSQPVALAYDLATASADGEKSAPGFEPSGRALPAAMLPAEIDHAGIRFELSRAETGRPNALVAKGQTVALPAGKFSRLHVLAASADGDQRAAFSIGDKAVELTVQNWRGFIGQWDNRSWKTVPAPPLTGEGARTVEEFDGLTPGFVKPAPVAWFASHHHTADGANDPYAYAYLFDYTLDVPADARTLTLPDNDKIRILAITVTDERGETRPAQPLVDTLTREER
ncbi:MAG: alpha-mannosidase [Elusimicrobia bacterium]|nr:alpha-mannosidase [Elusimicrobiota bacterium]